MPQPAATKLLALVQERQCMLLEELPACFPELTWNQVFLLVDELSRQTLIRLRRRGVTNCARARESLTEARSLLGRIPHGVCR